MLSFRRPTMYLVHSSTAILLGACYDGAPEVQEGASSGIVDTTSGVPNGDAGLSDGCRAVLEDARDSDNASQNVYYHLLLDRDDCCTNSISWSGIGGLAGSDANDADWGGRDAMTKVDDDEQWEHFNTRGLSTVVHELGHNHGRPHAPCGGPSNPDPNFPDDPPYGSSAGIGTQGYHIEAEQLVNPFPLDDPPNGEEDRPYKDVMSYCKPRWWSDYNWQINLNRIKILTSWDSKYLGAPTHGLRIILSEDNSARWSVVRASSLGGAPEPQPIRRARFTYRGKLQAELGVRVLTVSEGQELMLGIVLPPEGLEFDHVEVHVDGRTLNVDRASILRSERLNRRAR